MLIRQLTVGPLEVCCYIVGCPETGQGYIIDPGGEEQTILAACKEAGVTPLYIVNTHGHPDHVCGNAAVKAATGARIVMHQADAEFFSLPEISGFFSQFGMAGSPPPDLTVKDGDILRAGTLAMEIIHTPGHTPGGICLYLKPNLFTGDTLFAGAVGRTDLPGGSFEQLLASIRGRLLALPEETVVWPGHDYGGASSTLGEEKVSNYFLAGGR